MEYPFCSRSDRNRPTIWWNLATKANLVLIRIVLCSLAPYNTPMANEKTVLILTSAEGHKSIADALVSELASEYLPVLRAYRPKIFDTYTPFYQFFPSFIKIPYKIGEFESSMLLARTFAQKQFGKLIRSYIHETKPHAVISTYFLYDDI